MEKKIAKGRDYKKEAQWYKERYKRFYLSLTPEYGEKLSKILNERHTTFTPFIKELIDNLTEKN